MAKEIRARSSAKQYRSKEKKQKLLEITKELIGTKGSADVSMREIAAKSKIPIATVYHYYPNKDAIIAEIMNLVFEGNRNHMEILFSSIQHREDLRNIVDQAVNAYFDIFLETDKLQFRDRTTAGGAGQAAGIEILTLMEGTGKVGIQNPSPTADLDLVDGGTFRSTRLLTVNITADDTLTESEHAGRYCFVTGASRTITLGATTADVAAGIHYTLISNDANGFTLTSTKTMNGSSDDITVTARNAVTIIADGSNYVVLGA